MDSGVALGHWVHFCDLGATPDRAEAPVRGRIGSDAGRFVAPTTHPQPCDPRTLPRAARVAAGLLVLAVASACATTAIKAGGAASKLPSKEPREVSIEARSPQAQAQHQEAERGHSREPRLEEGRRNGEPATRVAPGTPAPVPSNPDINRVQQPSRPPHVPCPEGMALVEAPDSYCIDRWEASLVLVEVDGTERLWSGNQTIDPVRDRVRAASLPDRLPQGYVSGQEAEAACLRAQKRLCEPEEWVRACRGPQQTLYPYGNERRPNLCNDRFQVLSDHPVVRLWRRIAPSGSDPKLMWYPRFMNDPRLHELPHTVTPTGSHPACCNEYGVFDMVGNLHEWVADPDGTFLGGFFMDTFQNGEGCEYRTRRHPIDYHDYSTGFRCCADVAPPVADSTGETPKPAREP